MVMRTGEDVTEQYRRGAACALRLYQLLGCEAAVLKERSPSCGCGAVYDGTFASTLTAGDGVTAALLRAHRDPCARGKSGFGVVGTRRGKTVKDR